MSEFAELIRGLAFYARFSGSFTTIGYRFRRLTWDQDDFNLANQVWLVTGAYGGIGSAIVSRALACGAEVIAVGRNSEKLANLARLVGANAERLVQEKVDLSLQAETHQFVEKLSARGKKIDVLVNNVGILNLEFSRTAEGHEASYATNLLNHHILTEGVIEGGALAEGARIINVASGGLYNVPRNTALLDQAKSGYNGVKAYASHKRAQLALADYYQRLHLGKGLRFYAMHPGWVDTAGVQKSLPTFRAILKNVLRTGPQGADTIIWLGATAPTEVVDKIWFDRKPRPAHIFKATRSALATVEDVVDFLNRDIERFKSQSTAQERSNNG